MDRIPMTMEPACYPVVLKLLLVSAAAAVAAAAPHRELRSVLFSKMVVLAINRHQLYIQTQVMMDA